MLKKAKDAGNKAEIEYWDKRQLVKKLILIACMALFSTLGAVFSINVLGSLLH